MILGYAKVNGGTLETQNQNFVLASLTNFKVERPFLLPAMTIGISGTGFLIAFSDLLFTREITIGAGIIGFISLAGLHIGRLHLHGGDLRGTTLGHALWGRHASLNAIRAEIVKTLDEMDKGDRCES